MNTKKQRREHRSQNYNIYIKVCSQSNDKRVFQKRTRLSYISQQKVKQIPVGSNLGVIFVQIHIKWGILRKNSAGTKKYAERNTYRSTNLEH